MAPKKSTKIVLLGKRTKEGENLNHLIKGILPQFLPNDFIHEMSFTFNDDHIYEIEREKYPATINLNDPQELVDHIHYKYPESLDVIEIILNLDNIKGFLEGKSSEILGKIFDE
tara:strand:- start:1001 stop:1342 length:342 start_codon:yes stop_codon:yes gene_type:complete